jgi:hypothetical protein
MKQNSTDTSRRAAAIALGIAATMAAACSSSPASVAQTNSEQHPDGSAAGDGGNPMQGGGGMGGTANIPDGAVIFGTGSTFGSPEPMDASCGSSSISAAPPDVSVLLVIDESGSMTDKPAGFGVDKWTAMKTAMHDALTATNSSIAFGLELFPFPVDKTKPIPLACTDNCCEMPAAPGINVAIGPSSTAVPKILSALDASGPAGGTPTAEALRRALDYFTKGAGATLKGDRYVLLATDGGPNCDSTLSCDASSCTTNLDGACSIPGGASCCDPQFGGAAALSRCLDDAGTEAQIKALRTAGVRTFVVGIPGSEVYGDALDAFATAGGEALASGAHKYFAVAASGGVTALGSALESITKGIITTCRLVLGSKPPDLEKLNVTIDGAVVPQAGPDGWSIDTSSSPPAVVLKGATCAEVEKNGAQKVVIQYGCPTLITR